jgi:hypothetical protein
VNAPYQKTIGLKSSLAITISSIVPVGVIFFSGVQLAEIDQKPYLLAFIIALLALNLIFSFRLIRIKHDSITVKHPFNPFHKTLHIPFTDIAYIEIGANSFDKRMQLFIHRHDAQPVRQQQLFVLPAEQEALVECLQNLGVRVEAD